MLPQSDIDESFADRRLHGQAGDYAMKMSPTGGYITAVWEVCWDRSAMLRLGAAQGKVLANRVLPGKVEYPASG